MLVDILRILATADARITRQQLTEQLAKQSAKTIEATDESLGTHLHTLQHVFHLISSDSGAYRLTDPVDWLDEAAINQRLARNRYTSALAVQVLSDTDSTNRQAKQRLEEANNADFAILAEHQTAGYGRSGRDWVSIPTRSITLTLALHLPHIPDGQQSAMTLVIGYWIIRALIRSGYRLQLKWPNDIVTVAGDKVAGILVETPMWQRHHYCLVGVGINLHPAPALTREFRYGYLPSGCRSAIAAGVIQAIAHAGVWFRRHGFAPLRKRYLRLHHYQPEEIIPYHDASGNAHQGRFHSIGDDGALLLRAPQGIIHIHSATL